MIASLGLRPLHLPPWRFSFLLKLSALAGFVAVADRLFYFSNAAGATLGLFVLVLLGALVAMRPEVRRSGPALAAATAAAWYGFWLADDPGPLAFLLAWVALGLTVLLPRAARFGNGLAWIKRLAVFSLATPFRPLIDIGRLRRVRRRTSGRFNLASGASTLLLPLAGTGLFLALFATANPLIGAFLGDLDPFAWIEGWSPLRLILWLFVGGLIWRLFSPRLGRTRTREGVIDWTGLPGVSTASVTISLLAFNALFALQNGLDLAFLWSGAPLPDGITLAEYAHRGAYPLIGTALLAGGFVLLTTRPGTEMARSAAIQRLVYLWLAQNIFLVTSTMLRTVDYIEAYQLTELRIQALVWMALVAVGLMLICLRLALGRSGTWLVNANLLAATLVLSASVAIDYDRIAAGWNVRHAREVGGRGAALDLCHLSQMGDSALLPLLELEGRRLPPELRERVTHVRRDTMHWLERRQTGDGWDWRGARRLAAARERVASARLPAPAPSARDCDGRPFAAEVAPAAPVPAPSPEPQPLTADEAR